MEPDLGMDEVTFYQRWLAWERAVHESEVTLGGLLGESFKVAIIRRRAPPTLRTHLELHAADYEDIDYAMKRVIEGYFRARAVTLTTPSPMHVGYSQVGLKRPIRDLPKVKEVLRAGIVCHRCGGRGHFQKECASREKGATGAESTRATTVPAPRTLAVSPRPRNTEMATGRATVPKTMETRKIKCCYCGKLGHVAKECRKKQRDTSKKVQLVSAEEEETRPQQNAENQLEVSLGAVEVDEPMEVHWLMPLEAQTEQQQQQQQQRPPPPRKARSTTLFFVVDSGTQIHVLPVELLKKFNVAPLLTHTMRIKGADGAWLAYFGRVLVTIAVLDFSIALLMEVAAVRRPLLSVGRLLPHGGRIAVSSCRVRAARSHPTWRSDVHTFGI